MRKRTVKRKGRKRGITIRLFGGEEIKAVKRDLRRKGCLVEELEEENPHLEITVSPKKREEVEEILKKYGCLKISSKPRKNCNQAQQSQLITA